MEEKQPRKWKKQILIKGIPTVIVLILSVIGLDLIGFPIGSTLQEWGNKIPVVSYFVPDPVKTSPEQEKLDEWKQKYEEIQADLKSKEKNISSLKDELSSSQATIAELKSTNSDLQSQLKDKQAKKIEEESKRIADIYTNMQDSKAAAIIGSMSLADAAVTISLLDQDKQSSILAKMEDTKKAAQITLILKDIASLDQSDLPAFNAQVQALARKQDSPADNLAQTLAAMPASQSAELIKTMMTTNQAVALNLMKNVSVTARSQILTEIAKSDAKLAALITTNLNQ